ncbi:MAG: hypothetical protein AAGD06_17425 [Acidobacteriota bacterium]
MRSNPLHLGFLCAFLLIPLAADVDAQAHLPVKPSDTPTARNFDVRCTADCAGAKSVICTGFSCHAADNVGCVATDAAGNRTERSCKDPKTLPFRSADSNLFSSILDKPGKGPWVESGISLAELPHGTRGTFDEHLQALEGAHLDLTGTPISIDREKVEVVSRLFLASCSASCGNEDSVTCTAEPGETCDAINGIGCSVARPDGGLEINSCAIDLDG